MSAQITPNHDTHLQICVIYSTQSWTAEMLSTLRQSQRKSLKHSFKTTFCERERSHRCLITSEDMEYDAQIMNNLRSLMEKNSRDALTNISFCVSLKKDNRMHVEQ